MLSLYFRIYLSLCLAIALAACGVLPTKTPPKKIYWPKPPEVPRFVHEIALRSADDIKILSAEEKFKNAITGIVSKQKRAFAKPYDIAARGGKVVVTDSASRIALMFDIRSGKLYPFGIRKEGRLSKPLGVAIDERQWIYVADVSAGNVKIYDPLGLYLRSIGVEGDFARPVDVAVSPSGDRIYVVDSGGINTNKHNVTIFDADANKIKTIGKRGTNVGEFNLPISATVGPDGTLYVLDAGNFRVQAFDRDGNYLTSWGKVGRNLGDFARPRGIAVDSEGMVYVTDAAFRNFQIFTPSGELLMPIGGAGLEDKPGQYVLPAGIAIDETNRIYIVDQLLNKVDVIRRLSDAEIKLLSPSVKP